MWGFALVLAGLALAGLGVRLALERPRPLNLGGMLLAPLGLCLAFLGVGRMLSPTFFGRSAGAPRALRIMPAGDSLTRGFPAGGLDTGGYRGFLWTRLAGRAVDFVGAARSGPLTIDRDHESWDGITVDELAARLDADLPGLAPDLILLQVGTNDVVAGTSPEVIAGRLGALIDGVLARAPRAQLLVATLPGVRLAKGDRAAPESIAAVNSSLRAAVADRAGRGEPIRLVDMHAQVARSDSYFADDDGLHPSLPGYQRMAEVWFEAVLPFVTAGPGRSR